MNKNAKYLKIDKCIKCNTKSAYPIWCYPCYKTYDKNNEKVKCIYCYYETTYTSVLSNHMKFYCKFNPLSKCNNKIPKIEE